MERIGRKCFNCLCIYGCKIKGGESYDCVTCTITSWSGGGLNDQCSVVCSGNTTGGACPACMKVYELTKLLKKEDA